MLVAVTGAPAPVTVDGRAAPFGGPLTLAPGAVLALGMPPVGLRSYLAVRGGVDVPPVLGSRSTDTLSGLGPAPLSVGDRLPVGDLQAEEPFVDVAPVRAPSSAPVLRVLPGPRRDWLDPSAWTALTTQEWTVTADSNRVGLRLSGPQLDPRPHGRAAQRGAGAGGAAGAARRRAGAVPGRPPGHRRLSRPGRGDDGGPRCRRAAAARGLPTLPARSAERIGSTAGPCGPATTSARAP